MVTPHSGFISHLLGHHQHRQLTCPAFPGEVPGLIFLGLHPALQPSLWPRGWKMLIGQQGTVFGSPSGARVGDRARREVVPPKESRGALTRSRENALGELITPRPSTTFICCPQISQSARLLRSLRGYHKCFLKLLLVPVLHFSMCSVFFDLLP